MKHCETFRIIMNVCQISSRKMYVGLLHHINLVWILSPFSENIRHHKQNIFFNSWLCEVHFIPNSRILLPFWNTIWLLFLFVGIHGYRLGYKTNKPHNMPWPQTQTIASYVSKVIGGCHFERNLLTWTSTLCDVIKHNESELRKN